MNVSGGISIHAFDVASGIPATGLQVRLLRVDSGNTHMLAAGQCDHTGVFNHPSMQSQEIIEGRYVVEFDVADFFRVQAASLPEPPFLDTVRFDFGVADRRQHYHLPFKFTAWGYSLFRGGL